MASTSRRSARHLVDEIKANGPRFRFFQAVRLLALSSESTTDAHPQLPARLRFGSALSLAFQPSEITSVAERNPIPLLEDDKASPDQTNSRGAPPNDAALDMTVSFMGLTGPSGVLPTPYTELLIDRRNQFHDKAGHEFLDLFTHRTVSLFFQSWRKYRFYLPFESGNADGFSRNLLDIVGVGLQHLQRRLLTNGHGIPDRFLIHYAGLLSQKPVSAVNIAALVRGYFAIEAEVEQFVGQWMSLPLHEQSALDNRPCHLGQNTFVGERLWDRQTKMRLKLGPLKQPQFQQFMPGQPGLTALRELVQFCVGLTLDCDVTLILEREDIPPPSLAATKTTSPQLGYNLWLNSRPPQRDAQDVSFILLGKC